MTQYTLLFLLNLTILIGMEITVLVCSLQSQCKLPEHIQELWLYLIELHKASQAESQFTKWNWSNENVTIAQSNS